MSPDYYYRIPVRSVYKSYAIYAPDREPPGYLDWLATREPEVVFDADRNQRHLADATGRSLHLHRTGTWRVLHVISMVRTGV